jgi:hypothetical protein
MDWVTAYSYFRMAVPAGWRLTFEELPSTAWQVTAREPLTGVFARVKLGGETMYRGDVTSVRLVARRLSREIGAWKR